MRAYANYLAPHNIRVNTIHPCGVNTVHNEFTRRWLNEIGGTNAPNDYGNALPVDMMDPDDVAAAVAWLVSPDAKYVTGVTLPVDAGFANKR